MEFDALRHYLLSESRQCLRPPIDRFRHPWIAPMPLSPTAEAYLNRRQGKSDAASDQMARPNTGDGFATGDYSLGLFHHDASEAAIELLQHSEFIESVAGSFLCLTDCAAPSGRVHRVELCHKTRDGEPAKPVICQFAWRIVEAMGDQGPEWIERHRVLDRCSQFIAYLEREYTGLHGLILTHSSLASGFDSDILTATLPDKSVEGPDTNAMMILEYEALSRLHRLMGHKEESTHCDFKAERLRDNLRRLLWYEDDQGGFFVALRWQHGVGSLEGEIVSVRDHAGKIRPLESWSTLLPLYARVPTAAQAERMIARITRPEGYWGPYGVRTVPADDIFFHQAPRVMLYDHKKSGRGPVSNWSGPLWILSNYYLAIGLSYYGRADLAQELALKTGRLLSRNLSEHGRLFECYNDQGEGLWPARGTFLSWNVLALTLLRQFSL